MIYRGCCRVVLMEDTTAKQELSPSGVSRYNYRTKGTTQRVAKVKRENELYLITRMRRPRFVLHDGDVNKSANAVF